MDYMNIIERLCILSFLKNHILRQHRQEEAPNAQAVLRAGELVIKEELSTSRQSPFRLNMLCKIVSQTTFFCWKIQSLSPFLLVGENVTSKKNQQ